MSKNINKNILVKIRFFSKFCFWKLTKNNFTKIQIKKKNITNISTNMKKNIKGYQRY